EEQRRAEVAEPAEEVRGETLLDVLVARMGGRGVRAHQVWLPPLQEPPTLDQLLPPIRQDTARGLTVAGTELYGALKGVVGIIDRPFEQRRDLMWLDLSGAAGNVVVVGGPQRGKTTVVRTLRGALALPHTRRETQFSCLDCGGGGLIALGELPPLGGVAPRRDVDAVRRTVAQLRSLLLEREQRFAQHGVDG